MSSKGVAEFYANKSIFVTGGGGFIGKILIEKLLRCCSDIKVIYLLMRNKKGQDPQERLNDIIKARMDRSVCLFYLKPCDYEAVVFFNNNHIIENDTYTRPNFQCFEKIKDRSVFSKLCVIPGDILEEDLGMSEQDRCILQKEVQIVFHSAASVRFNLNLRDAISSNLIGTKRILELAEGMENLEVFVHISTSFCHDELQVLEEKMYPALHKPEDIINCVNWMSDDMLMKIQPELIKPYVNTYGYSKNLTEDLVAQFQGKFTIAIARPSVVVATHKEPMPGWVDNINGPTGVLYAGASGLLHTSYCKDTWIDLIPVDMVVNGCILLAYTTSLERPKEIRVCNITDFSVNKITWIEATKLATEYIVEYPLSRVLYYPAGEPTQVRYRHKIDEFFFHILPAYFIDFLLFLFGQKTFMANIEKRIRKGTELLEYYTSRNWVFKNDYFRSLKNQLSKKENEIFYTDLSEFNYVDYLKNYHLGVREFIANEDLSTLPQARRHLKRLYYLHMTLKTLFYVFLAYCAYIFIQYFI